MKNTLRIDFQKKSIIMDRTFAKNCSNPTSEEYIQLQRVRQDYPDYLVRTRSCKKNAQKESYKGLTYEYMEHYIITHEDKDSVLEVLDEYNEMHLIAECHSKSRRYPVIKRWFLAKYPEIVEFGLLKIPMHNKEKANMQIVSKRQELAPTGTDD